VANSHSHCWLDLDTQVLQVTPTGSILSSEPLEPTIACHQPVLDARDNAYVALSPGGAVAKIEPDMKLAWRTVLSSRSDGSIDLSDLCVTADRLFVLVSEPAPRQKKPVEVLYCLNLEGKILWQSKPLEWYGLLSAGPNNCAYVATRSALIAFSPEGQVLWESAVSDAGDASLSADGYLFLTTLQGELRVYEADSGKMLQQLQVDQPGLISEPAIRDDGSLIILTAQGNFIAVGRD
jgi:hypothetical protein